MRPASRVYDHVALDPPGAGYWGTVWTSCRRATLSGSLNGNAFTAKLRRPGATYTGHAAINDYWLDCEHTSKYEDTTLTIRLTATSAAAGDAPRAVTAFAGTVTWNVPPLPDGCPASLYEMRVTGGSS